ncbi:hypothetical protein M0R45_001724 [Rubus argutus]|uniref:hAT-like transposase RNase-H fold domain-containing protein n=1 Tax=Rubus argutus TaxID=59490 RepID=A0AAW1VHB8_RUBAR
MAVTAHFVDKDWKVQKRIISFSVFPHPHNGVNIAKALEWGLDKVFTITLDNAKNNDICVQDLVTRLNRRNAFLLQGEFFHIRCFAHVLNLVVRAGIEKTKVTVKRLRRSVKYVRSSPSRFQAFKKCVEDEGIPTKKYLCLDVKTRWNSSYLMINAALGFRKAFERLEDIDSFYKEKVDHVLDSDWNKLNSLHIFLKDFYDITMRVSGSCYVTSTTYMDEIKRTKAILDMHVESADYELRAMALLMNEKFEKYCKIENVNPILLAAMVLDPRNKMQYAVWMFKKYWGVHLVDGLVAQLKDFMTRLYNQYKQQDKALGISTSKRTLTDLQTSPGNQQVSDGDRAEFNQYLMEIERLWQETLQAYQLEGL